MTFKNDFTTDILKVLSPEAEKNKIVISDFDYLQAEQKEEMNKRLANIAFRLGRE